MVQRVARSRSGSPSTSRRRTTSGQTIFGQGDFDLVVFGWVGTPFPSSTNKSIYTTDGGQNAGKYSNPQVDKDLNGGRGRAGPDQGGRSCSTTPTSRSAGTP